MTDIVLANAVVHTMDANLRVSAAVGVRDGRIAWTGDQYQIEEARSQGAEIIDLGGSAVLPGFIDPHNHFSRAAFQEQEVNCATPPLSTLGEVLDRIAQHVQTIEPGLWVRGWGFHWSRIRERRSPTRVELDHAAPDNPLVLIDASYHGCFVNSLALSGAGLDRHSPPGLAGILVLDDHGEPTGALLETAMNRPEELSWQSYADRNPDAAIGAIERHGRRHLALGITAVADALVTPAALRLYEMAEAAGRLPLPIDLMLGGRTFFEPPRIETLPTVSTGSGRLRGTTVKLFMDAVHPSPAIDTGSGADGAHIGANYYSRGEAIDVVSEAVASGFGVAIHALGNCAIDQALDVVGAVRGRPSGSTAPIRIEHFILASREQARRAADLGVSVATNPGFLDTWGDQYLERWRVEGRPDLKVIPVRTLLDAGVRVASASDHPCDDLNPFHGIWAAVTRRSWTGEAVDPEESVSVEDAIRMYTSSAAQVAARDRDEGSIEVGKRANLIVLDRDPFACAPAALRSVSVLRTYLEGVLVHNSTGAEVT